MANRKQLPSKPMQNSLEKCLTGIKGFDEITNGGLPRQRLTLVSGEAGNGKSLLAMQFLVNGTRDYNEPGLFVNFEVRESEIIKDFSSLNFNLQELVTSNKVIIESIFIDRSEFVETGTFNLEGLFMQIGYAIDRFKIKRVVLDTIEVIFGALTNEALIRSELQRLFNWLKEKGVTTVVTAERGAHPNSITRFGLEEYVADCVILLDHRIVDEISTRRIRVLKYRGSAHGENEYPFLIDRNGINVLPITSLKLDYKVANKFISTGINKLNQMLNGKGFYQGSSVLFSGTSGVGKSSFAASFANSICSTGKKCLYICFEESKSQVLRNMASIGIDLEHWVSKGLLYFVSLRPNQYGLEKHLITMLDIITELKPNAIILDPVSNFKLIGTPKDVKLMLVRLVDFVKERQITTLFTSLIEGRNRLSTQEEVSSLMDVWINLQLIQNGIESNRVISIIKSRGMNHSNQMHEVEITSKGIVIKDINKLSNSSETKR